jgi:predicted patatin/cPLA2 family phospholipase
MLNLKETGLVLEGGGMRGLYTAGVLDYFMERNLYFPYVVGVSAGACQACSYLSRQIGRNRKVNIDYIKDPRYLGYGNMLRRRELFGMDFIFDDIPNKLVPFDYQSFDRATERFVIGTTDCETGLPWYFEKGDGNDILQVIRASSSLPFMAPVVRLAGKNLLDGGVTAPIPVHKSEQDGNTRNVLILTQHKEYRKKPAKLKWLARRLYSKYPNIVEAMYNRHNVYNQTLEYIEDLETRGRVFVIRPGQPLEVGRVERNPEKLTKLFEQGYADATQIYPDLQNWLNTKKEH